MGDRATEVRNVFLLAELCAVLPVLLPVEATDEGRFGTLPVAAAAAIFLVEAVERANVLLVSFCGAKVIKINKKN